MTNREQLSFALGFGDYENRDVADILSDFMWAVDSVPPDKKDIEKWLGLECDENNNWGVLDSEEGSKNEQTD